MLWKNVRNLSAVGLRPAPCCAIAPHSTENCHSKRNMLDSHKQTPIGCTRACWLASLQLAGGPHGTRTSRNHSGERPQHSVPARGKKKATRPQGTLANRRATFTVNMDVRVSRHRTSYTNKNEKTIS